MVRISRTWPASSHDVDTPAEVRESSILYREEMGSASMMGHDEAVIIEILNLYGFALDAQQ